MKALLLLVMMALLAQGLLSESQGARAQQSEAPENVIAFGRQVAASLEARRYEALADLFITHDDQCPLFTPGGLLPICEGVAEGGTVTGYKTGQMGSDAALSDRDGLVGGLRFLRDEYYGGSGWRLYAVGLGGLHDGYMACATCRALVISRPAVVQSTGELLYFQVTPPGQPLRIHSLINGSTGVAAPALIEGGTWRPDPPMAHEIFFVAVPPAPPGLGTGLATPGTLPWIALAIGTGFILLAGAGTLFAWSGVQKREATRSARSTPGP